MKKNKKGFTLVELLAVIVILGVLLIVAVPAVNKIMVESKQKAAIDNANMMIKALETCRSANDLITYCDTSANVKKYYEGSGTLTITAPTATAKEKIEINFNGYKITITADAANKRMDLGEVRGVIQSINFGTSKTASKTVDTYL